MSERPAFRELSIPLEESLDGTLGFELLEVTADSARSRTPVTNRVKQPYGLVHGGVYAAMAESLASQATTIGVQDEGNIGVGLANHTSFMRPVLEGYVNAEARLIHRGRTTWVWEIELTDDQGRLCALSRMTMAIQPRRR